MIHYMPFKFPKQIPFIITLLAILVISVCILIFQRDQVSVHFVEQHGGVDPYKDLRFWKIVDFLRGWYWTR